MSADAKQVFGTVFVFVGEALGWIGWGLFFYAAGAALLYSGGREKAKDAREEALRRARAQGASAGIKANVRGASETHYLVFGKVRMGGVVCALGIDQTAITVTSVLHIGLAHSICHAGGCEGVGAMWVNDEKINTSDMTGDGQAAEAYVTLAKYRVGSGSPEAKLIKFRHWRGTGTQGADPILTAAGVAGGESTAYRRGIAWTRVTLTRPVTHVDDMEAFHAAFPRGVPEVSFEFSGNRCYDPRLDSTNGGSGSHRVNDVTTWAWSQNPAIIAATYQIMAASDGGMGYDSSRIDWDSVASAANVCDETATSTDSPTVSFTRYQCNVALNTGDSRETNLRKILDTMRGARVKVGSKFKFYAGAYRAPTATLDDTYLRGSVKASTRAPLEQLFNAVRLIHDDASQNYRTVEATPFTSAAYEVQDGGERMWKEETLFGVTNTYQAQYIGQVIGAQSRKQKILELPCNLKALDIEAWETVTVTLAELGISGAVYRCIAWEWEGEGPKLTLREESADVYSTAGMATPDSSQATAASADTPEAPGNVSAAGILDGIALSWDSPEVNSIKQIDIYRADSSSPTTFALVASVVGYTFTDPLPTGQTYFYKLQARGRLGNLSAFSSTVSSTSQRPPDVASQGNGSAVYAEFDPVTNTWVFRPVSGGNGITTSIDADDNVVINADSSERDHLILHSDRSSTSTTLADILDFKFALEPNTVYEIWVAGLVQAAATTTGFKLGATAPAGTALMTLDLKAPGASGSSGFNGQATGTTAVSLTTTDMPASATTYPFTATFRVVTGPESGSPSTGFVGDFQIQFATEVGGSSATLKQYTTMVLSKLTTMTPSATLTLANPGMGATYTSEDLTSRPDSATATITVLYKSDGTFLISGIGLTGSPTFGNWGTPTTAGAGSDYELMYAYSGLTGLGSISNDAPTWTTLDIDREFEFQVTKNGIGVASSSLTLVPTVRKRGTTTPTSTDSVALDLTAQVEP